MLDIFIRDAEELVLETGIKFGETREGKEVLEMARLHLKHIEDKCNQKHLSIHEYAVRKEDMSRDGRLRICKDDDSDILITVIENDGTMACVEFCRPGLGGGKSPRTVDALEKLAIAILEDNVEEPSRAADR